MGMRCALTCSAESWRSGVPGIEDCLAGEECGGFSMVVLLFKGDEGDLPSTAAHCAYVQSLVQHAELQGSFRAKSCGSQALFTRQKRNGPARLKVGNSSQPISLRQTKKFRMEELQHLKTFGLDPKSEQFRSH